MKPETLGVLAGYSDDRGNSVTYDGPPLDVAVAIRFHGSGNHLHVDDRAKIRELVVDFYGNDGSIAVGPTTKPRTGLRFAIRVGHGSKVTIGADVGSQTRTYIIASEGASVSIGDDCMLASSIEIRTDDSHPIFDVRTEKRINAARSITIGDHVWIGKYAAIFGGSSVGSGSVIGFRSIVTRKIPNNCIAAGSPARVLRRDVAWERPKLNGREPGQDKVLPKEKSAQFWNLTEEDTGEVVVARRARVTALFARLRRGAGKVRARLRRVVARRSA